jgi:arylsulfatase A-like enzyme
VIDALRADRLHRHGADRPTSPTIDLVASAGVRGRDDGEVHQADARLAAVSELLKRAGRLERTLVVIAADHGETLFEHEETPSALSAKEATDAMARLKRGHNAGLTEVLLRTPLIFAGPGVPRGFVHPGPTENLDIVPTVLELLGVDADGHLDGTSLVHARKGAEGPLRPPRSTASRSNDPREGPTSERAFPWESLPPWGRSGDFTRRDVVTGSRSGLSKPQGWLLDGVTGDPCGSDLG